jgi:hypothetical protein
MHADTKGLVGKRQKSGFPLVAIELLIDIYRSACNLMAAMDVPSSVLFILSTTCSTALEASLEVYSSERLGAWFMAILDRKRENAGS